LWRKDANVAIEKYVGLPPICRALSHVPEYPIMGLVKVVYPRSVINTNEFFADIQHRIYIQQELSGYMYRHVLDMDDTRNGC
jgi:hypothetical protein